MTEADRDFVVKVRAAGLWEYPVGMLGLQKDTTVRTAGDHLVRPTPRWTRPTARSPPHSASPSPTSRLLSSRASSTLTGETGKQFDTDFANILRMTHGSIFNTVAKIRSTTKNSLVRQLADQANIMVLDHITVMEKTGLVNFDQTLFQQTTPPRRLRSHAARARAG